MALGYLLVAVLAAAVAVFALQNSQATSVRFLGWTVDGLPLAAVSLIAFASGLLIAGIPFAVRSWRWRSRARSLERRLAALENQVADHERMLLQRPPASPPPTDH
jgi:uncharacterized integral membrane protein